MLGGDEKAHDLPAELSSAYYGEESSDEVNGGGEHEEWGCDTHLLTTYNNISLRSMVYHKGNPDHDFSLMALNPKYAGTLIIYSENYMCWRNPNLQSAGGGSAVIRPMAAGKVKTAGAYVAGVVTGYSSATGGFDDLGRDEKLIIDLCFYNILNILKKNIDIHNVIFACDPANKQSFGTSIFNVSATVVNYISGKFIELLARTYNSDCVVPSLVSIELTCKNRLDKTATLIHSHHMWRLQVERLERTLGSIPPNMTVQQVRQQMTNLLTKGEERKFTFDIPVSEWHLKRDSS
jgi:hypothetical protein